jgi:large subunit ribosomal protein L6
MPSGIVAKIDGKTVVVTRAEETQQLRSLHGLNRSLVANMLAGVANGYSKELEIEGVGYKAEMKGARLVLALGLSHPVDYEPPKGITLSVKGNSVTIAGADKQTVGDVAARIRSFRPPEPYKGKGLRYKGEHIRRKAGKTVA